MKVVFDGAAQYHPATGLDLVPGEMEVDADKGGALIAAGLVQPAAEEKPARRRTVAPEPASAGEKE